jgi:hypothetical protein
MQKRLIATLCLPTGDTCGVDLQRDVWGCEVERETASVDIQCLHFASVVRVELLPDFLQEAGEIADWIRNHHPRPWMQPSLYCGDTKGREAGMTSQRKMLE